MEKLRHFLQSEKEKLRTLNRRQRLQYFWDYYKLPIGAVLLAAAMLIYTLCYNAGPGKIDLNAVLVNAQEGDSTLFSQALQAGGWKSPQVRVDTTLTYTNAAELAEEDVATIQVLFAQFTMGDMDLFAANPEVFQRYTDQDGFENLGLVGEGLHGGEAQLYLVNFSGGSRGIGLPGGGGGGRCIGGGAAGIARAGGQAEDHDHGQQRGKNLFHNVLLLAVFAGAYIPLPVSISCHFFGNLSFDFLSTAFQNVHSHKNTILTIAIL